MIGGTVYRLAIIAYTRQVIGDCLQNQDALGKFADGMSAWFDGRPDLWEVNYDDIPRPAVLPYHATETQNHQYQERGKLCPSFADPSGNYSAVLDALEDLEEHRNTLSGDFWLELLIAILRHNSPSMLRHLIRSWLPGKGDSSETFENGLAAGYGAHTLFLLECERRNIDISNGQFPRCQWSMHDGEWPDERKEGVTEQIRADIETMRQILRDAEDPRFPHRVIIDRVQQIKHIGRVKALGFYTIAVHAGYLTSQHAIRESHDAILHPSNPAAQELIRLGLEDLDMALRRLAWRLKKTHKVVEHSLCKKYRKNFCWDFIAEDQRLYCCKREMNDMNQELTRFYRRKLNEPWQEYTPSLRAFHR